VSRIIKRVVIALNHRRHSRRRLQQIRNQPFRALNPAFVVKTPGN